MIVHRWTVKQFILRRLITWPLVILICFYLLMACVSLRHQSLNLATALEVGRICIRAALPYVIVLNLNLLRHVPNNGL